MIIYKDFVSIGSLLALRLFLEFGIIIYKDFVSVGSGGNLIGGGVMLP